MHALYIHESALDKRRGDLPHRFQLLTRPISYVQGISQTLGPNTRAIGICRGERGSLAYDKWRVSLIDCPVSLGYYEIWQYCRRPRLHPAYLLQKAYLHVFRPESSGNEEEILFIHCDPQETPESQHYRYKASPHLHFPTAGRPWAEAHVPLCDGWQDKIMGDLSHLDDAFRRAIEFVADEIIPLCRV